MRAHTFSEQPRDTNRATFSGARATRCSGITPMEPIFQVSERVLVEIKGFDPWPATIENVVSEETKCNVKYHVRLDGSSKSVPINPQNIKHLKKGDEKKWNLLCPDERWHGARKRNEVVEGVYIDWVDDGVIPSPLWNFISVENNYEDVPDVDKANLKLSRVAHNAKVRYTELETKFTFHAMQNKMQWGQKDDTDDYELVLEKTRRKSVGGWESKTVIRFPCPMCSRKFKTRMALKKHIECSIDCTESKDQPFKTNDQPQQCPKCFALYKNEEMLLKHMMVHDKFLPKKKNGIRDYIRQIMANNKACRVPSYNPANGKIKPNSSNGKTVSRLQEPKKPKKVPVPEKVVEIEKTVSSPDESEQEDDESDANSTSDTDSVNTSKLCRTCMSKDCTCRKKLHRNSEIHSEREKERRLQMRQAFAHLADILGVDKRNHPKNTLLQLARDEIQNLEDMKNRCEQTLTDLQDMNIRLVSREYQLKMK